MNPEPKKEVTTIASVVGGQPALHEKLCIDSNNRLWTIIQRHSGCILRGKNTEIEIPYWTCYAIELKGLKLFNGDYQGKGPKLAAKPSLLEELLRLSAKDKDIIQDEQHGLLWGVKVSEHGLELQGFDDNHWLPMKSLGGLSFGELTRIRTGAEWNKRRTKSEVLNYILARH